MPTRVMYNGSRLIPAPLVRVDKQYSKTADGENIGTVFSLSIVGKVLAFKGSPDSSGNWWTSGGYPPDETIPHDERLGVLIRKQEALRELFSEEGHMLEFQSADGTAPMKCNPRIISIEFTQDIWYNYFDYTINLEADVVYVNGQALGEDGYSEYITEGSETWAFDTDEDRPQGPDTPRTYRVTHNVSAKGKRFYDDTGTLVKPAWKWAQDWVLPRLGFDETIALSPEVNNLDEATPEYGAWNHIRNEQIDEKGGNYSVTETWVLASTNAIEEFTVSSRNSIDTGLTTVNIEGQVTGLEERNANFEVTNSKYTNAQNKFAVVQAATHTRAQSYSGVTLNVDSVSNTVGRNPVNGVITYSYEYNNRPSNLITGTLSESISVQDNWGVDSFAPIFVLGRNAGPVIQNLGTHRERSRQLNIELVMPIATGSITDRLYTNKPSINPVTQAEIQAIVTAMYPGTFGAVNVNVSDQSSNWDGQRFALNISWVFELSNPDTLI